MASLPRIDTPIRMPDPTLWDLHMEFARAGDESPLDIAKLKRLSAEIDARTAAIHADHPSYENRKEVV